MERLIAENGPDLLSYFLRRTAEREDAADLLHNTFLVIWRRRGAVPSNDEKARMWFFGIARNMLRDGRRAHSRREALSNVLIGEIRRAEESTLGEDPAKAAERAERASAVRAALGTLDDRSRELVILVHWDHFSLVDAAKQLRMNPSTARTRYARARARLAEHLQLIEDESQPPSAQTENPMSAAVMSPLSTDTSPEVTR
ncbi:RNA polymerase sigma factor [Microbacterium phyllosphaerae]|uniref:RNA polymerase sigma factor n=1 Tax=Microbacterium phyllosphaerae TaxID=124798 RepID=UPI003D65F091